MPWKRLYEHDANGTRMTGNLGVLIKAVGDGNAVRVIYHAGEGASARVAVFPLDVVYVRTGVVHGQGRWIAVDFSPANDHLEYPHGDGHYMLNVSTTGKVNRQMRTGSGQLSSRLSSARLEWICDM